MTNNQPPELLSDKELRQLSELFWQFHNDRLDDPTLKEMKPYIQPILDLINQQTQAAEKRGELRGSRASKISLLKQLANKKTPRGDDICPEYSKGFEAMKGKVKFEIRRLATLEAEAKE